MGLSSKQVSGDQGLDWGHTFRQSAPSDTSKPLSIRRQQPPQPQSEALKCPRCSSTNTKFCYYNNYNKSQPRHFCKSCKRHWTKGGTLRNVPVGGGRKNKRPKISKPAAATTSSTTAPATAAAAATLRQQDFPSFPSTGGQKNMSNILYQALIGRSSSPLLHETSKGVDSFSISGKPFVGDSAGLNATAAQIIPSTEFQFSSLNLSTIDMNGSLNPGALYHHPFDHFAGSFDSVEESTITSVNVPGSSGGCAWAGPESSSSRLELPSYWNWNEIDVLTSGDLSISWDDQDNAVIKP